MEQCFTTSCVGAENLAGFTEGLKQLKIRLSRLYPRIRAAYPNADIFHVGYPRLTPERGTTPYRCGWLEPAEQDTGDNLARKLNQAIRDAADSTSYVSYVDPFFALEKHELCTTDSWMVDISIGGGSERGHPNGFGQDAYARAVAGGINTWYAARHRPGGVPQLSG